MSARKHTILLWVARLAVGLVFVVNVHCALSFLFFPESYVGAYELSGLPGAVAVQGIGVAFLMWNATYPLVVVNPEKYRPLFGVVLAQQLIGLLGETWILSGISPEHALLQTSILQFISFDTFGLIIMTAAFVALAVNRRRKNSTQQEVA